MSDDLEQLITDAYRYAYSLSTNESIAWDLVQESWLRVYERYDRNVTRPLLYRTVRNLFLDRIRHETRFPSESVDENSLISNDSAGYSHDPALDRALRSLPDIERETLFLAIVEGYTAAEITALTGHPRGSVLSRLHRSRQKLAKILKEEQTSTPDYPVTKSNHQTGQKGNS